MPARLLFDGFKFGMLLQLAIGPVCLLIFTIAENKGFLEAMLGVSAVVLVDAAYILLATTGVASLMSSEGTGKIFRTIGALIVAVFGIATILSVFGYTMLPHLNLADSVKSTGSFAQAFVLTAANPLTILFWAGVFSTRVGEERKRGGRILLFGTGCVLSTLLFLTLVSLAGSVTRIFLPDIATDVLNGVIGLVLLFFAGRMLYKNMILGKTTVNE